jgi:hypothetical protein
MGQRLTMITDPQGIAASKVPADMPACPARCLYSNANFNPRATREVWGSSGLLAPDTNDP